MSDRQTPSKVTTAKDYEARLLRVLKHIDENLGDSLKREDLAAIAHFSPFHFHRIFKGMTGETLGGYIRRRRLIVAASKLRSSKVSITEIALDAVFENSESFSRAFKQLFGVSPSHYRSTGQVLITPQGLSSLAKGYQSGEAIALLHYLQNEARKMSFDVEIKTFPAIHQAYIRHIGPYQEMGPIYGQLMASAAQQGLLGANSQVMSLYYDDPQTVEASALRADAGVSIADNTELEAPLKSQVIAAGDYGVALLKGPYEGLQAAYLWLYGQWLPNCGREAADKPAIEVYLTDPSTTKPEDNLTEIRIPLI